MPRVKTFLTAQYSCERRPLFVDAPVTEVSPGEIVLVAREAHLPGEPLGLRLRVGGRAYNFGARVVSCKTEAVGDGERTRHLVVASLAESEDSAEERVPHCGQGLGARAMAPRDRASRLANSDHVTYQGWLGSRHHHWPTARVVWPAYAIRTGPSFVAPYGPQYVQAERPATMAVSPRRRPNVPNFGGKERR